MKPAPFHNFAFARPLSLASRLTRVIGNLFLTLRPYTSGRAPPSAVTRIGLRASQYSLTPPPHNFAPRASAFFLLLLFTLSPFSAHAQANPTVGGGGACTGWTASDTTTQGAQLAENDGLYTCQSSAWVPETLVVGSVTQSGAVPTCSAATAGMLYYTGGTVEFCNGTSFTTFGGSVALSGITAATAANTISSGSNAQVWNWSLAGTGATAFTFGEAAAATSGGQIVNITTLASSTATPLTIQNGVTASTNPISINMTAGAIAIGGTNTLMLPYADGTSIAVGQNALHLQNATSEDNTAVGFRTLFVNTSGIFNTAMGYAALYANVSGGSNTAVGHEALYSTTGNGSTAIGSNALLEATGGPNDALGDGAGQYISTGTANVALGYDAMTGVSATPLTGSNNTAVGNSALYSAQGAAAGNTALGYQAGDSSNPTTTGTNNVFIGYQAGALNATDTNEIAIGALAMGRGSNSVVIGNGSITDAYFGMTTTCTNGAACGSGSINSNAGAAGAVVLHAAGYNRFSDQRLKKDIHDSDLGLDFILKLRPVSYVLKAGKSLMNYGFIAQEVEKALDGRITGMVTREKDEMGTYEIDYSSLIAPTVKAVQQQQQEIADDKQQIADLKQLIAAQQKEIAAMKATHTPPRPHPTYE